LTAFRAQRELHIRPIVIREVSQLIKMR